MLFEITDGINEVLGCPLKAVQEGISCDQREGLRESLNNCFEGAAIVLLNASFFIVGRGLARFWGYDLIALFI